MIYFLKNFYNRIELECLHLYAYCACERMYSQESIKVFGPKSGQGIKIQVKEAEFGEVVLKTNNLNDLSV